MGCGRGILCAHPEQCRPVLAGRPPEWWIARANVTPPGVKMLRVRLASRRWAHLDRGQTPVSSVDRKPFSYPQATAWARVSTPILR
jgi:hypothetical protein